MAGKARAFRWLRLTDLEVGSADSLEQRWAAAKCSKAAAPSTSSTASTPSTQPGTRQR